MMDMGMAPGMAMMDLAPSMGMGPMMAMAPGPSSSKKMVAPPPYPSHTPAISHAHHMRTCNFFVCTRYVLMAHFGLQLWSTRLS